LNTISITVTEEKRNWKEVEAVERIILNYKLKEKDGRLWTRLVCFRIWINDGLL
jgi:hypothetical protein